MSAPEPATVAHTPRDDVAHAHAAGRPRPAATLDAWPGRTGCIGYVAKMFPRISETFILEEILALKRQGVPVKIYSLLPPVRDARMHPEAQALLDEVTVLGPQGNVRPGPMLSDLVDCWRVRPVGTIKNALRALLPPDPLRAIRRLERGVALARLLREDHVAHVHAAWAHAPASVTRIACRLTGIPWSMGAHAKDIHLSEPASLAKKLAAARFTIACSQANRDLLAGLLPPDERGRREGEVMLIHHGVDVDYFTAGGPHADGGCMSRRAVTGPPIILSVGRLVPKKGFDVLLRAAALLVARGVRFRMEIVGEGPERGRLDALARTLGIAEVVTFRGMLVRDEVREAYRRASCFALACRVTEDGDRDGVPNTLAEAMACSLPVVSTNQPGVEEIVRDQETGRVVPAEDPAAMADALADLLADPAEERQMGERARHWLARHFDARTNGERRALRLASALGVERVLYVSADRGVPVRGSKGASIHVRSMVEALSGLGAEVRILTTRRGPASGPAPHAPFVEGSSDAACGRAVAAIAGGLRGGEPFARALSRLLDNLWMLRKGRVLAQGWRPDVVYERYALSAVAGAFLARHLRVPFVLEMNSPLVDEEQAFRGLRLGVVARWLERWLLCRADRVVVVSWALHAHAMRLGVRHEDILVLPNAVDPRRFAPRDAQEARRRLGLDGHPVVGFCGSLKRWHGVHRLLDAVALAAFDRPDVRLLIVGDGPERDRLEARAHAMDISERVRFVGAVPHDDVPEYLAACDVLAAPYEAMEGFYFSPLKVAEYLAVGKPILLSDLGEVAQTLAGTPGVTLVRPGDPVDLAQGIVRVAEGAHRRGEPIADAEPPAPAWTWRDVAARVLESVEHRRREQWAWKQSQEPVFACVLDRFPDTHELRLIDELLRLERSGTPTFAFALRLSTEDMPRENVRRLRSPVQILDGPGAPPWHRHALLHFLQLLRTPLRYVAAAVQALARPRGGALQRFVRAPAMASEIRRRGIAELLAASDGAHAQAVLAARFAGILATRARESADGRERLTATMRNGRPR